VCREPEPVGQLADPALVEASGLVASRRAPGALWLHNDSGDRPRLFLAGPTGAALGIVPVEGATAVDWEDLAIGPCASGSCLFVADLGDNARRRASYAVYRLPEPADARAAVQAEALTVTYDDGAHDAEALLVHPETGAITVVEKRPAGPAGIYDLVGATLTKVGELVLPDGDALVTGGATRAGGILLRTYASVYFFPLASGATIAEALAGEPCVLPSPPDPQGEAIAWDGAGAFLTVSEGANASIYRVACE